MQPNELAYDVITKTPAAQGEPILALAGCNGFEFLDVMPASTVMGIFGKDSCRALFGCVEIAMAFLELVGEPIVTRSGANRKGRGCYALRRLRLVVRVTRSANSS